MRDPSEAIAEILGRIGGPQASEIVSLRSAAGRCLEREVVSDLDLPPFEKSAMDGFALRSADARAPAWLECIGESRAGARWNEPVPVGRCVEIYTGAELPPDCDAVVMVERTRREGARVRFEEAVRPGQNVNHKGEVLGAGRVALRPPRRLSPVDLALLAAVGCEPVPVWRRPRVSILTTGDELVPVTRKPESGQIREGNTLYLAAAAERAGAEVLRVGIVPDDARVLEREFEQALSAGDALVTTGGVSMGRYDLVGPVLEKLGVSPVLHNVAIKPGKPIWFGMRGRVPVFGLPGNPVSSLLGFELFVRPALARMGGAAEAESRERLRPGRWMGGPPKPDERQNNLPVRVEQAADGLDELWPLEYKGSADIQAMTGAQGFAVIPPGESVAPGQRIHYRPLG